MVDVNRPNPWLAAALCTALAVFYLLVLYWMLYPQVDEGYRAYYIDRSTSLTQFEQMKAARNLGQPARTIHFDDERACFVGWYETEDSHRWSEGRDATVEFTLETRTEIRDVLVLSARYLGSQRVTVELNGVEVAHYDSMEVPRELLVDLPEGLLKADDTNTMRFRLPDAAQPDNGDPRILALALRSLEIY